MPIEDWGVKRVCPVTGRRFYDLNRSPVISPYTGEVVSIDEPGAKMPGPSGSTAKPKKPAKPAASEEEDDLLVDNDDSSDVYEDLLDDDDDDSVALDDLADVASEDDDT